MAVQSIRLFNISLLFLLTQVDMCHNGWVVGAIATVRQDRMGHLLLPRPGVNGMSGAGTPLRAQGNDDPHSPEPVAVEPRAF